MAWTKAKRSRYPKNWEAIREEVRQRAGDCCEGTPQFPTCRVPNHSIHPVTGRRVVCTVMHLWDMNPMACELENLRFACNRCHLSWDRPHHLAVQRRNRERKKLALQPRLFDD